MSSNERAVQEEGWGGKVEEEEEVASSMATAKEGTDLSAQSSNSQKEFKAALDALIPIGFSKSRIERTLHMLLRVYGGEDNWPLLKDNMYAVVVERILEDLDEQPSKGTRLQKKITENRRQPVLHGVEKVASDKKYSMVNDCLRPNDAKGKLVQLKESDASKSLEVDGPDILCQQKRLWMKYLASSLPAWFSNTGFGLSPLGQKKVSLRKLYKDPINVSAKMLESSRQSKEFRCLSSTVKNYKRRKLSLESSAEGEVGKQPGTVVGHHFHMSSIEQANKALMEMDTGSEVIDTARDSSILLGKLNKCELSHQVPKGNSTSHENDATSIVPLKKDLGPSTPMELVHSITPSSLISDRSAPATVVSSRKSVTFSASSQVFISNMTTYQLPNTVASKTLRDLSKQSKLNASTRDIARISASKLTRRRDGCLNPLYQRMKKCKEMVNKAEKCEIKVNSHTSSRVGAGQSTFTVESSCETFKHGTCQQYPADFSLVSVFETVGSTDLPPAYVSTTDSHEPDTPSAVTAFPPFTDPLTSSTAQVLNAEFPAEMPPCVESFPDPLMSNAVQASNTELPLKMVPYVESLPDPLSSNMVQALNVELPSEMSPCVESPAGSHSEDPILNSPSSPCFPPGFEPPKGAMHEVTEPFEENKCSASSQMEFPPGFDPLKDPQQISHKSEDLVASTASPVFLLTQGFELQTDLHQISQKSDDFATNTGSSVLLTPGYEMQTGAQHQSTQSQIEGIPKDTYQSDLHQRFESLTGDYRKSESKDHSTNHGSDPEVLSENNIISTHKTVCNLLSIIVDERDVKERGAGWLPPDNEVENLASPECYDGWRPRDHVNSRDEYDKYKRKRQDYYSWESDTGKHYRARSEDRKRHHDRDERDRIRKCDDDRSKREKVRRYHERDSKGDYRRGEKDDGKRSHRKYEPRERSKERERKHHHRYHHHYHYRSRSRTPR